MTAVEPPDGDVGPDLPADLPPEVPDPTRPDQAFERHAELVRLALGVPVALVSLVSDTGQVFPGAVGLPAPWQQTRRTPLTHSFCQYVVADGAPLVVQDARRDPELADNMAIDDLGVVAYAGFPLHDADGRVVGSLCAIDSEPRRWSTRELDLLERLAASAATELVLRGAVSAAADARAAEDAVRRAADRVNDTMAVGHLALDHDGCVVGLNREGHRLLRGAGDGLVGRVLWQALPDAVGAAVEEGCRRAAADGEVVSFEVHHPEPVDAWFELRAVPQADGLALYFLDVSERHVAQAAAQRVGEQLSVLGRVALSLTDAETMADLVETVTEQGLPALGADGGSVAVPDPDDPAFLRSSITASFGEGTREEFGRVPLAAALPVCEAARTGRRVLLADEAGCAAMSEHVLQANAATGCQAWASVPLRAGGELLGVLTAGWAAPQVFGETQLDLLETLAAQCAQALQRLAARDAGREATDAARAAADRAELSDHHQRALVGIAQALAEAAAQDDVLEVLADQGVALLDGNGCGLCLRSDDGRFVDTLVTDSYAEVRTTVQRVPADFPLPAIRSAATGTAIFLPGRAETESAFPGSAAIYERAGVQATAALPLRSRGRLLGCLSVGFSERRVWTAHERDLLAAFAALTAQTLDRIAAHDAEQAASAAAAGISETLQRSMLTAPPEPDHLQVAVRYAASADHAEVGGDWYDAFVTSEGLTSVVIGDVTGHDMKAAAVMGQLRNLLRGIAFTLGEPPARVLAALDRASAGLGVETVATVVLAQVEQSPEQRAAGTRLLRWSNAGHLPPLLLGSDGAARFLEAPSDLVLGWDPAAERHDHEVVLQPGETVLLYTDGLVERRGASLQRGLVWLAETASSLASGPVEELLDSLLAQVEGHLDDDVALLALRAHPEDGPRPAEAGPARVPERLEEAIAAAAEAPAADDGS